MLNLESTNFGGIWEFVVQVYRGFIAQAIVRYGHL